MRRRPVSIVLAILGITSGAVAQSYCLLPTDLLYPWLAGAGATAWQKGSAITLFIVSPTTGGFTSGQITNIESALGSWSTTAGTNLSITNTIVTSAPTTFPSQYILVQFGDTSACGAGVSACTSFNYNTTTGYPTYSIINVNTSVGSANIAPLMTHEIGHTYIIADCPDSAGCSASSPWQKS